MRHAHPPRPLRSPFVSAITLALLLPLALPGQIIRGVENWPKRDDWQRPSEVMDALRISAGSVVADIGTGEGYFAERMARRVGPTGTVYAQDLDQGTLATIKGVAASRQLPQIIPVVGTASDVHLPNARVDAILVVDAFHEFTQRDSMLLSIFRALKPGGLLGIIDVGAEPRPNDSTIVSGLGLKDVHELWASQHRIPKGDVIADVTRAGFRQTGALPGFVNPAASPIRKDYFFLLFEKPR